MYTPKDFILNDSEEILSIIDQNPFATVISIIENEPLITHLPINRLDEKTLYGHVALANPHSQVKDNSEVTVIFMGDRSYISPTYYQSGKGVPTWNYSAIHCKGKIQFIEDLEETWQLFKKMVNEYEGEEGWALPEDKQHKSLMKAIRFFKIEVEEFIGKAKASQNKSEQDKASVIEALRNKGELGSANSVQLHS